MPQQIDTNKVKIEIWSFHTMCNFKLSCRSHFERHFGSVFSQHLLDQRRISFQEILKIELSSKRRFSWEETQVVVRVDKWGRFSTNLPLYYVISTMASSCLFVGSCQPLCHGAITKVHRSPMKRVNSFRGMGFSKNQTLGFKCSFVNTGLWDEAWSATFRSFEGEGGISSEKCLVCFVGLPVNFCDDP